MEGYGYIEQGEFDPLGCIALFVFGRQTRIRGCNINAESQRSVRLFEGITRHRVPRIRESGPAEAMQSGENETVIEELEW